MRHSIASGMLCLVGAGLALASACTSSNGSPPPSCPADAGGGPATGAPDTHCVGRPPQPTDPASCSATDAGAPADAGGADVGAVDSGAADTGSPQPGICGANTDVY